ncbi:hypothetical protein MUK42_14655 [Musa troglodytarum]|uniref:ATPase inhibitor n=1 Tax=Musa troglodytarum TaxID=320322 RepID=A0A9E7IB54_9LILI|nr:hypothetical protein MUK42_14655 [Musa troglodytarum]
MAMRSATARVPRLWRPAMEKLARRSPRFFSDDRGRILSEEERAAENVYIQKMERERMEKLRRKAEKERLEAEKAKSEKGFRASLTRKRNPRNLTKADADMLSFLPQLFACVHTVVLEKWAVL